MRVRLHWFTRWSWRVRSLVLLVLTGLAATGVGMGFGLQAGGEDSPGGPPWRGDPGSCKQDPMSHVHHPHRLDLLARCATISGTVRHVDLDAAFNDLKIVIVPDPQYRRYLRPQNRGEVVADVIATDLLRVPVPEVGSHVVASGAWVSERPDGILALHPTYRIHIDQGQARKNGFPGRSEPRARGDRLELRVKAPDKVGIGEAMTVTIDAFWTGRGRRERAPEIHLFTELTDSDGTGVRWQAARTNTLGTTTVHLIARHVPGRYTFTAYATPSGSEATATTRLRITR